MVRTRPPPDLREPSEMLPGDALLPGVSQGPGDPALPGRTQMLLGEPKG